MEVQTTLAKDLKKSIALVRCMLLMLALQAKYNVIYCVYRCEKCMYMPHVLIKTLVAVQPVAVQFIKTGLTGIGRFVFKFFKVWAFSDFV